MRLFDPALPLSSSSHPSQTPGTCITLTTTMFSQNEELTFILRCYRTDTQCCGPGIRCDFDHWIRDPEWKKKSRSGIQDEHPGFGSFTRIRDPGSCQTWIRDPGSWIRDRIFGPWINIPVPQHCPYLFCRFCRSGVLYYRTYRYVPYIRL